MSFKSLPCIFSLNAMWKLKLYTAYTIKLRFSESTFCLLGSKMLEEKNLFCLGNMWTIASIVELITQMNAHYSKEVVQHLHS